MIHLLWGPTMSRQIDQNHSTKCFDASAISSFTFETIKRVDHLTEDGRCNLIKAWPEQPGGLAYYGIRAIRSFDPQAHLGIVGLVGATDRNHVLDTVRSLEAETRFLLPVSGKQTNKSEVILGPDDRKIIVRCRQAIGFEGDLNPRRCQQIENVVARSHSCLLGNLPAELTARLISHAREMGTYTVLGAGSQQLGHLADLSANTLMLNQQEARQATGLIGKHVGEETVFNAVVELTPVDHVVIMTGGDRHPIHVADRISGQRWQLPPKHLKGDNGFLNTLGAGDTMAGTIAFLLGQKQLGLRGDAVLEAVGFARDVVTTHLTQLATDRAKLRARYREIRDEYLREPAMPVLVG
jgi:sugar/nucleoside kinase (ribokinase family)